MIKKYLKAQYGFTLIEIVTVISIIAVLSAVLLVNNRLSESQLNLSTDAAGIASAVSRAKALTLQNLSGDICGYGVSFKFSNVADSKDYYVIFKDFKNAQGICDDIYTNSNEILPGQESRQDLGGGIRFVSSGNYALKDVVFYSSDAKVKLTGFTDTSNIKITDAGAGFVTIKTESIPSSFKTLKITTTGQVTTKSGQYTIIDDFDDDLIIEPCIGDDCIILPPEDCIPDCSCANGLAVGETCSDTCGGTCVATGGGGGCPPQPTCNDINTSTGAACVACSEPNTCQSINNTYQCLPPACGNDVIEGSEVCDGTDLNSQSCAIQVPGSIGSLSCNNQCSAFITTSCIVSNPAPVLNYIDPIIKNVGDPDFILRVYGGGFIPSSKIRFNGLDRTTTFVSAAQLTAAISATDLATSGNKAIAVFTPAPGGGTSGTVNLTVNPANNPVPVISSISPTSKTAGSPAFTLTVNGSNFINSSIVKLNGSNRSTAFVNSTRLDAGITATDIATAGTKSITVFTPTLGGGTSVIVNLSVNPANNPYPVLSSISPTTATLGNIVSITVNGNNFIPSSKVYLNGALELATIFNSSTKLTASWLASFLGNKNITVFTPPPGGGMSKWAVLTVNSPPPTTCTAAMCTQWGTCSGSSQTCTAFNQTCTGSVSRSCTVTCTWGSKAYRVGENCIESSVFFYACGSSFPHVTIDNTCLSNGTWFRRTGCTKSLAPVTCGL